VAPLRALIHEFAALLTAPTDAATTARIERAPTHRATAWSAGMNRGARAAARPRPRTWQTRSKAACRTEHRPRTAAAVRSRVNCHRNSICLAGSTGERRCCRRAGGMTSSRTSPATRVEADGHRGLRSGRAIEVNVIDTVPHSVLTHGAERRVRRRLLDDRDRQQKRENENKFGHWVHSFGHLWHARVMPENVCAIVE